MSDEIHRILERAQPGARQRVVAEHISRGRHIRESIVARFGVASPRQWRAKHVRWHLERGLAAASSRTRYHHYRTIRAIAAAMGRWDAWEPHLRGPWVRPSGEGGPLGVGRPALLARPRQER